MTLAAPIDFARSGMLRRMVDPSWFDADSIADAGNVAPSQMQAGFTALRPTLELAKAMTSPELALDAKAREAFLALSKAVSVMYPALIEWLSPRLVAGVNRAVAGGQRE